MSELSKRVAFVLLALIGASCADSEVSPTYMGNTNWLTSCGEDDDCSDGLSCECGVCTLECESASECNDLGAVCDSGSQALVTACGSSIAPSLCLPECTIESDCGGDLMCVDGHCLPDEVAEPPVSGGGDGGIQGPVGCGPIGAFASGVIAPDEECVYAPDNPRIANGLYDVSSGFNGSQSNCDAPYVVSMLAYSCLQGVNDTLQIHSAEVRLMDISKATIAFDRFADEDTPAIPNPFVVTSNATIFPMREDEPSAGITSVELIPTAYAEQLDNFDGEQLLAEIRLSGTTVGGVDVELKPFTFVINICDGCLTLCGGNIPTDVSLDEIYGEGVCRDSASADGRICIDASCTAN